MLFLKHNFNYFLVLSIILFLSGCQSSLGPNVVKETHPGYNSAVATTLDHQMLLNLVRLKYRDEAYFLKVSSITASMSFSGSFGVSSSFDLAPGGNLIKPDFGVGYTDKPTITYQPVQGEDFLKNVLSGISLDSIMVLTQSGWSIERVFGLCVERTNRILNAPTASGPTPLYEPEFKQFKQLLGLLKHQLNRGNIEMGSDDSQKQIKILFQAKNKEDITEIKQLGRLLGFSLGAKNSALIKLNTNFLKQEKNQLTIRTRSILSVMFYLAQNIDVPIEHVHAGLVTITQTEQGDSFDWGHTPAGSVFKISSSREKPENAHLAIPYRDFWYYIADNDLESKTTFMLLKQLFDIQSGQTKFSGPALTLPVR